MMSDTPVISLKKAEEFAIFMQFAVTGRFTVSEISSKMNIPNRRVNRLIASAENFEFIVDRDFEGRIFIDTTLLPDFIEAIFNKKINDHENV